MQHKHTQNEYVNEQEGEKLAATFVSKLQNLTLTKTEAQDMRERLLAYSNLHAVNESDAARTVSPYSAQFFFSYFSSYPRAILATALVVIILVSGTGVSYAAENTLPGEPLYAVKVSVVEPIQGALITGTLNKAKWQNELTERRLTEASTLAAKSDLATSTQEYLAQAVSEHVALAQADASQLSASGNDADALSVNSDLDAKLSAHADFLTLIAPRLASAGDASTTNSVLAFLNTIQSDRAQVEQSRLATEVALGDTATSSEISASSTPAEARAIAYVDGQNSALHTEETTLFRKNATLFALLPPAGALSSTTASSTDSNTASTTASTTISAVASSTEATSTESNRFPFYKPYIKH